LSMTSEVAESGDGSDAWLWLLAVGAVGVVIYLVVRSKQRG
jgi:hypothetical protein